MQITPIDNNSKLYRVEQVFSTSLVNQVLDTDWINVPWAKQETQENWLRRRIDTNFLPWFNQWEQEMRKLIPIMSHSTGYSLGEYSGTAFWLDEPGFTCALHTDGEMPGSFHLTWIGSPDQGTAFYNSKNSNDLRYRVPMQPNAGYIMINLPDDRGYRELLWHGMLFPVEQGKFRLTSYSWLMPQNNLKEVKDE